MAELPTRTVRTHSTPVERDAEGYPLCRQCKKSIRDGKRPKQRTFCGNPECLHLWKLKSDTNYQAEHVLKRDKGVCSGCGLDCLALLADLKSERLVFPTMFVARCQKLGLPRSFWDLRRRLWEMDHIVPVIEGGGSCGLENLRTLCWACHRKETAALAARRAEARKAAAHG
jgi:5-methylcytosine-specific restriction endonuclease McrA